MKRRGVSEVTGSVLMLGIVGTIAALVLTFGLGSIYDFNAFLIDVDQSEASLKERVVINNVDFQADGDIQIYVRNVGLNDVIIESFAITNIDTQIHILFKNDPSSDLLVLNPKTVGNKLFTDSLCATFPSADTSCLITAVYNISIVTTRGNIFENEVRPFRV